jgi:hypothetical protein
MKLSSLLIASIFTVVIIAVLLMVLGVNFRPPLPAQGAALYNPANEVIVKGVVAELREFACPVSEGELGSHLMLNTPEGVLVVHLAPGRIMRSQNLTYSAGDQIAVIGSKVRIQGANDLIAREVTRNNEVVVLRDRSGQLMLMQ